MKRFRVWKAVLLTVVTLGLYSILWFVFRRNEIVENSRLKIPHWLWFILPLLSVLLVAIPGIFVFSDESDGVVAEFGGAYLLLVVTVVSISLAITVWWAWQFAKAYEKVTQGRVHRGWALVYCLFLDGFSAPVLQYFANRSPKNIKNVSADTKNKYKTSRKFLGVSLLIIGVSALLAAATSLAPLPEFADNYAIPASVESKGEEANALLKDYNDCIDRLDTKYPVEEELLPEDEDAYLQDYDACETIRIKQNAAAAEYNKSLEQL